MIIKSSKDLDKVYEFLKRNVYTAYDIETTGLNTRKDDIIGFGISNSEEGFYIVHKHWNTAKQDFDVYIDIKDIKTLLNRLSNNHQLITWNGSFDLRFTKNFFKTDLIDNLWSEAMLAKHTVDEERPFGLKDVAANLYGEDAKEEQIAMKASIKENGGGIYEFYKADLDLLATYCIKDCILTFKINEHYLAEIKEQGLHNFYFNDEVMPLYKYVTIPMEDRGIPLDIPKMEKAQKEITLDIQKLEEDIQSIIKPHLSKFETWYLNKEFPVSRTPANPFVQKLAEHLNINMPKTKSGKFSLTAKNLEKLEPSLFKDFMISGTYLPQDLIKEVQLKMFEESDVEHMFNLSSKHHLKKLFFDELGEDAVSFTDKGNPQVDEDFFEQVKDKYEFIPLLISYNKLNKIKSTYIDRFLEAQEDGIFYPSFKQHNTISGRYGSDLQQLPRQLEGEESLVSKYTNQIRTFFIAGKGYKIVDSDWESLEPHVFAHISGDQALKDIFLKGHDFYSTIAIMTEGLGQYSADKNADNYLGKLNKEARQKAKAYSLGIPYGMEDYALHLTLNIEQGEAKKLIKNYLEAFPNLTKWMRSSEDLATQNGFIRSEAGRIRHMPLLKKLIYAHGREITDSLALWKQYNDNPKKYSQMKYLRKKVVNYLNNCKNFQIQSLSASIANRACIAMSKYLKKNNINGYICAQIHDQVVVRVEENRAEEVRTELQYVMENEYKISIPLKSPAVIGTNFADAH